MNAILPRIEEDDEAANEKEEDERFDKNLDSSVIKGMRSPTGNGLVKQSLQDSTNS